MMKKQTMKKQMMLALVSLFALSVQAQANFNVSVSNPSKSAKTDAPVLSTSVSWELLVIFSVPW